MGWSAAETLGSCSAKTQRPKSRFKEYPGFAGGNKDGKRSIQRFRNLISEMVFRDPQFIGAKASGCPSWRGVLTPLEAEYISADQLSSSFSACNSAADHTFRKSFLSYHMLFSGIELARSIRPCVERCACRCSCAPRRIR